MDLANETLSSGADQVTVLSHRFADLVQKNHSITLPHNFLELSVQCGRTNILYGLAKGVCTLRPDKSDSKFPAKRMPAGFLQYMVEIVCYRQSISGIKLIMLLYAISVYVYVPYQVPPCPVEYRQWINSVYSLFGTTTCKWCKLILAHCGVLNPSCNRLEAILTKDAQVA